MIGNTASPLARADCNKCQHFAVSWDPQRPYLCRLMGFKSRALPSHEVMRVDGKACQGFAAKPAVKPATAKAAAALSGLRR